MIRDEDFSVVEFSVFELTSDAKMEIRKFFLRVLRVWAWNLDCVNSNAKQLHNIQYSILTCKKQNSIYIYVYEMKYRRHLDGKSLSDKYEKKMCVCVCLRNALFWPKVFLEAIWIEWNNFEKFNKQKPFSFEEAAA